MELNYILASVAFILISLYYYLSRQYDYWRKRGIPTANGIIPGIGHMLPVLSARESFVTFCDKLYKKSTNYSMFGFYRLTTPVLLIRDPELVKSVLLTNFSSFSENQIKINCPKQDELLSMNPFFVNGERWKETRAPLTNSFSSMKLKMILPLINNVGTKMKKYLTDKCKAESGKLELNLKKFCNKFTGEVASNGVGIEAHNFEEDIQSRRNEITYNEIMFKLFESSTFATGIEQMIVFFMPGLARLLKVAITPKEVDQFFRQSAKCIVENRKKENRSYNDFTQIALEYQKTHKSDVDEETLIASHMLSFAADVYETSACTMSFLMFELASRPEIQEKVRQETMTLLEKYNGELTYEALQEMTYLEKVLNESMRMNHAAGLTFKICTKEIKLVGSDGLSCILKPGNTVALPVIGLQMDPKYWPDPETFDPERFSEDQKNNRHKFTFLPFSEGPRACVGMRMAVLMLKMGVSSILRDFSVEVSPKMRLPWKKDERSFMNAPQGGFWVDVKPSK